LRIFAYDGGGIWNAGNLSVIGSTVSDNRASKNGGGIWNSGKLTITQSAILSNATTGGGDSRNATTGGGGIWNDGELAVTASTISGNSTGRDGGGIRNTYELTLTSSTISGNSARGGGGIWSSTDLTDYTTTITSSTISGNTASSSGGGLHNSYGLTVIEFSTIVANQAPPEYGSGVASDGGNETRTRVHSSIIAGNVASDVDFNGNGANSFRSQGYNVIGTGNALGRFNPTLDQTGITNPRVGPLAANGGLTRTHALLAGSPAIDRGNPSGVAGSGGVPTFDQRGAPYSRVVNGDATSGARIDIGAFELTPIAAPAMPGDYNASGTVDAADYAMWRSSLSGHVAPFSGADGDGDGVIDQDDYVVWRANFGRTLTPPGAGSALETLVEQISREHPAQELAEDTNIGSLHRLPFASLPSDVVFTMLGDRIPSGGSTSARRKAIQRTAVSDAVLADPQRFVRPVSESPMPSDQESVPAQRDPKSVE
jgi:hypothetical protein